MAAIEVAGVRLTESATVLNRALPNGLSTAFFLLCLALPQWVASAPKAELWERWNAHDVQSAGTVDHSAWDRLLQSYVVTSSDGIHRVRYGAVTSDDRGRLSLYLSDLQRTAVSGLRRDEQRAYWINLYNAFTVKLIIDRYPVRSIRDIDITPGILSDGPWGAKLIKVEDQTLSLDDIEHRILRPIWPDPRNHYAVNCASLGCPDLPPRAFTAVNTEAMLDASARAYVNHPRGVRVDSGHLRVSSIYDWFESDFGGSATGVIAHLRRYAQPPLAEALAAISKIKGHDYDWALNDAP